MLDKGKKVKLILATVLWIEFIAFNIIFMMCLPMQLQVALLIWTILVSMCAGYFAYSEHLRRE